MKDRGTQKAIKIVFVALDRVNVDVRCIMTDMVVNDMAENFYKKK